MRRDQSMSPAELLRELEPLTHAARVRRMVELGRAAGGDAGLAAALAALEGGTLPERCLALRSCYGSGDGAHVLRALADPSGTIRGLAARLVPIVCNDAQAQAALAAASDRTRQVLLRQLAKRARRAPIDAYLAVLAQRREEDLAAAIRFGSPDVAARFFEPAMERGDANDWRHLARRHPELVVDALLRGAEAAEDIDCGLIGQANAVLEILAETVPDRALALVAALGRHVSLDQLVLWGLIRRRPRAMVDLILGREDRSPVSFSHVARHLDIARLLAIAERQPDKIHEQPIWFGRLTPEQRAALYEAGGPRWRDRDGCLEPRLVALLRGDEAEYEARRHLALPALAARPAQRLQYAAFLPWEEAWSVLRPFARSPDAELRAAAVGALITAVRHHRDHLADVLAVARALVSEREPVRTTTLSGLAELPPSIWRPGHLEGLGGIIDKALDASDLSEPAAHTVHRLIVSLLPFHPAWSTQALKRMEASLGEHSNPRLRWMALRILQDLSKDARGWDEQRLARLRVYRSDRSPLVARYAGYTRLPAEVLEGRRPTF